MNQRIHDLVEQAVEEKQTLEEFIESIRSNPSGYYGFSKSELEKLYELIVRDCMKFCEQQREKILENPNDPSWTEHLDEVQTNIKQHFGVGE